MNDLGVLAGWLTSALEKLDGELVRARSIVRDSMQRLLQTFTKLRSHLADERVQYEGAIHAITGSGTDAGLIHALRTVLGRFIEDILQISQSSVKILMEVETLRGHAETVAARGQRIETIAHATRVISLNARIEAHRAGAAGAVFRVVADEIKALAKESGELSLAIRTAIALQAQSLIETQNAAQQVVAGDLDFVRTSHRTLNETIDRLENVSRTSTTALDRIQADIDQAITALQFEDMLDQLLGSVASKLALIRGVCARVADGDIGDLAATLGSLDTVIYRDVVSQKSVEAGTVELF